MTTFNPFDPTAAFLMGAGANMLQAGGWQPQPVGLGQALGAGLRGGQDSYMAALRARRMEQQRKVEEGLQRARQAKLDREAAQYAAVQKAAQSLPLEQRAFAMAFPQEFAAAQFRAPPKFTAQNFYDPDDPSKIRTVTSPAEQQMAIQMGYIKGNPPSGWVVETMPGGGTRVSMGRAGQDKGPLTSGTVSKTEQKIIAAQDNLARIDYLQEMFNPEYLEYGGRGKALTQDILNRLGLSEGEFAADRATYQQVADQTFNDYRVAVTGAGAGPTELKMLARSFPTMNDGPAVYSAKLQWLREWNEYIVKRGQAALDQGVGLEPTSDEYKQFVKEYEKTNPPPAKTPTVQAGAVPTPETPGEVTRETIDQMSYEQLIDPGIVDTVPAELLPYAMEALQKRMQE